MSGPPRVYAYYQPPSESGLGGDAVKGSDLRLTVEEGLGNVDVKVKWGEGSKKK